MKALPDEQSHGSLKLSIQRKIMHHKIEIPDDFLLRSAPSFRNRFSQKVVRLS